MDASEVVYKLQDNRFNNGESWCRDETAGWMMPANGQKLSSSIGFAIYLRESINHYAAKMHPLTILIGKIVNFRLMPLQTLNKKIALGRTSIETLFIEKSICPIQTCKQCGETLCDSLSSKNGTERTEELEMCTLEVNLWTITRWTNKTPKLNACGTFSSIEKLKSTDILMNDRKNSIPHTYVDTELTAEDFDWHQKYIADFSRELFKTPELVLSNLIEAHLPEMRQLYKRLKWDASHQSKWQGHYFLLSFQSERDGEAFAHLVLSLRFIMDKLMLAHPLKKCITYLLNCA